MGLFLAVRRIVRAICFSTIWSIRPMLCSGWIGCWTGGSSYRRPALSRSSISRQGFGRYKLGKFFYLVVTAGNGTFATSLSPCHYSYSDRLSFNWPCLLSACLRYLLNFYLSQCKCAYPTASNQIETISISAWLWTRTTR